MKIIFKCGNDDLARVYLAEISGGRIVEFVESLQPPFTKKEKIVFIISTLAGCPVACKFCDAGGNYLGKLNAEEMFSQIDYLTSKNFPENLIDTYKFKIQFSRMGEPALNPEVLKVLEELPERYKAKGLLPSVSSVAPRSVEKFFENLKYIKDELYGFNFQMQFSIHSTDEQQRDWLIPVKKWDLKEISDYGDFFFRSGDRKIALNFAVNQDSIIDAEIIKKYFSPDKFIVKLTPINPTVRSIENRMDFSSLPTLENNSIIRKLKKAGFNVIISIGELEENNIGSNCGQLLKLFLDKRLKFENSYTYEIETFQ